MRILALDVIEFNSDILLNLLLVYRKILVVSHGGDFY